MIWILLAMGYIACGLASSVLFTHLEYRQELPGVLEGLDYGYGLYQKPYESDEDYEERKEKKAEQLRTKTREAAAKTGVKYGAVWPIILLMTALMGTYYGIRSFVVWAGTSSIDKKHNKELAYKKAKRITDAYEKEQEKKWEESFNG